MPVLSNSKHERFAQEVAKGASASAAFVAAGYAKNDGNAGRLNRNEQVRARIEEILAQGAAQAGVTVQRVVEELAKIGFADIRNVIVWRANVTSMVEDEETGEERLAVTNEVQLIDSAQISDDMAAAIAEISQSDKGALKVKLHDKLSALDKLGKHLGMFREKVEHSGPGGGPIEHSVAARDMSDDELARIASAGGSRASEA